MSPKQCEDTIKEAFPVLWWYEKVLSHKPVFIGNYLMCNPFIGLMEYELTTNIFYKN